MYSGSDNRFKGLDLIDRVPEELRTEVPDTVQRAGIKTIPKKKKCKKTKWWSEKALQIQDLHDSDNHNGVITHLEPDILECEVK